MNSFKSVWEDNKFRKEVRDIIFEVKNNSLYIDKDMISFNSYSILEIIDAGANAIILKAKEKISNRICAIKVWFSKNKETGKLDIEKHKKEIEKIANFDSDLIVKYYSTEIVNNYAYCTMEYVEGETLKQYLKKRNPSLSTRYKIMNDIIKALRISHEKDIYHGDLHDRNILIGESVKVKVLDFGTSLGKKEYSMSRDTKLMYRLGKEVMGENKYKKLMWMNKHSISDLSPRTMRLILESMSKIIVLMDFLKYGVTEAVIEDIALFATLVPFFNLKYLADYIFEKSYDEKKDSNLKYFFERLNFEMIKRIESYNLSYSSSEFNALQDLYKELNYKFIEKTSRHLEEKYIYYDEHEVKLFKSNLYGDYIEDTYEDTNIKLIDKALEKYTS